MSLILEDENGIKWAVFKGDPAYEMVTKLEKKGYRYIVLPRGYFIGERSEPHVYEIEAWYEDGLHSFEMTEEIEDKELRAEYMREGERWIQLATCLEASKINEST